MSRRRKRKHISMTKRLAIVSKYNDTCVYCGRENLSRDGVVNIDHITPLDRGGEDCFDNYQLTCKSCNSSKGNRTHEEFLEYLRRREEVESILAWILENVPNSRDAVEYIDTSLPEIRKYQVLKPLYEYMSKIE